MSVPKTSFSQSAVCGDLLAEVCGSENDPDVPPHHGLFAFVEPSCEAIASVVRALVTPSEVLLVDADQVVERHGGDHGCIPQSLELHVPSVARSLEFHDDGARLAIDAKQIDSAVRVIECTELLRNDKEVVTKQLHVLS